MQDIIFALSTLDGFTINVAMAFVVIAFVLIREIVHSTALAVISAPVLLIGGLAANYLFHQNFVMATHDKDTNIVIASAVGVLTALVLLLVSIWISVLMSEQRTNAKKLMQLPDQPPPAEAAE